VAAVCCLAASTRYCLAVSVAVGVVSSGLVWWGPLVISRVSWLSVSSHLLHVSYVGGADLVFENLFSCAKISRSFLSSSYSSARIIS